MTKFSNKFKKKKHFLLTFDPFSPFLGAKLFFPKNSALSRTTTHGPLISCWVSEKTNQLIPIKLPVGRTKGQKDPNSLDSSGHSWGQKIENEVIKDTIIRDINSLFEQEEEHFKPVKAATFWRDNYIEYDSNSDKNKTHQS